MTEGHPVGYIGAVLEENQPLQDLQNIVMDVPRAPPGGEPAEAGEPQPLEHGAEAGPELDKKVEIPESIIIIDVELKPTSSVKDLRMAAKFLGVSQAGSKRKMSDRIVTCHLLALRRKSLEIADEAYHNLAISPAKAVERAPSVKERRLHELTHLEFWDCCSRCVACKSKELPEDDPS